MIPTLAICRNTIRTAVRSRALHVVLFFLCLTVLVLPLIIVGDGTAHSHVQISLRYLLGIVSTLLSIVTLWLGCTVMGEDVDHYQMHMVVTKPISRKEIWIGKWLGIVLIQGVLLMVSAIMILGLIRLKLQYSNFDAQELKTLDQEVFTARRVFKPNTPNLEMAALERYDAVRSAGGLMPNLDPASQLSKCRREVKTELEEVPFGMTRMWVFDSLPKLRAGEELTFKFRLYPGKASANYQRSVHGAWILQKRGATAEETRVRVLDRGQYAGGSFQVLKLNPAEDANPDGSIEIGYANADMTEKESVIFQLVDGPYMLTEVAGFGQNYCRVIVLIFLQIAFLAMISCAAGANLSIPVAVFVAFFYVKIGWLIGSFEMPDPDIMMPDGGVDLVLYYIDQFSRKMAAEEGLFQKIAFLIRQLASLGVISIGEFNEIGRLAKGELIEASRMMGVFFKVIVLRGLPIMLLGIYFMTRRELGLVIRK